VLNSPQVWRWFRDTWGVDNDEAARAVSWATQVLLKALSRGPARTKPTTTKGTIKVRPTPRATTRKPRSKR